MIRHAATVAFAIAGLSAALGRDPGCGGVDSPSGSVNAPCTRDRDCRDGLFCREGVCSGLDAGAPGDASPDGDARDASSDGG